MDRLVELVKKALPMIAVAVVGYLGETGNDGGFIRDIWNAAKTASPFAAMFAIMVWLDERRERREAQRQCNERTIDFIQSTNLAAKTFGSIVDGLKGRRR